MQMTRHNCSAPPPMEGLLSLYNVRDFIELSQKHTMHAGIVLAAQRSWHLSTLIPALERLLIETTAEEWLGQVRWLNQWRT
ncbi:MAG: hypothetical protein ETSY1_03360 [Candidatus Entotheonella factor]|uniref:Uncharacterized protein n=1 Tax=Entotheonella factor TaxID=1429438 RepID=W4LYP8_ENTF1|nr:MAG: hypothetical protein ETSY1_03360 [Candidatus Entotheonella factor]